MSRSFINDLKDNITDIFGDIADMSVKNKIIQSVLFLGLAYGVRVHLGNDPKGAQEILNNDKQFNSDNRFEIINVGGFSSIWGFDNSFYATKITIVEKSSGDTIPGSIRNNIFKTNPRIRIRHPFFYDR